MVVVRSAADDDAPGVIALIGAIFDEYPGCVLDVDAEEPELRAPASRFERFWVAVADGAIVGCIALATHPDHVELKKLYVAQSQRGRGLGRRLVALVEGHARDSRIELWSDTRFTKAHALYEHLGYVRQPETRDLHDLSNTTEYHYVKDRRDQNRE